MGFKFYKKILLLINILILPFLLTSCFIYTKKIDVYITDYNSEKKYDFDNYYLNIDFLQLKFNNYIVKEIKLDNIKYDTENKNLKIIKDYNKNKIVIKIKNIFDFENKKFKIIKNIDIKFIKDNNTIGYLAYNKPIYLFKKIDIDKYNYTKNNLVYINVVDNQNNNINSTGTIIKSKRNLNNTYTYYILATKHSFYNYKTITLKKRYEKQTNEFLAETSDVVIVKQDNFKSDLVLLKATFSIKFDHQEYDYLFNKENIKIYKFEPVIINGFYKENDEFKFIKKLVYIKETNVSYEVNNSNNLFLTNYYNTAFSTNDILKKGTSGGAVYDSNYNLIGINSASNFLNNTYHISLYLIKDFLKNIKELY